MEYRQGAEETIEDVVDRVHLHHGVGVQQGAADDLIREVTASGDDPRHGKNSEGDVAGFLPLEIDEKFAKLERNVGDVMYDKGERTHPGEIARKGKNDEGNSDHVVSKHLEEIFAASLQEMRHGHSPVETKRDHVISPHVVVQFVLRVTDPTMSDIVEPDFV